MIPNFQVFYVSYVGESDKSDSHVNIYDARFKARKTVSFWQSEYATTIEVAIDYLQKNGFNIIGKAEGKKGYLVFSDTFKNLCNKHYNLRPREMTNYIDIQSENKKFCALTFNIPLPMFNNTVRDGLILFVNNLCTMVNSGIPNGQIAAYINAANDALTDEQIKGLFEYVVQHRKHKNE